MHQAKATQNRPVELENPIQLVPSAKAQTKYYWIISQKNSMPGKHPYIWNPISNFHCY